MDTGKLFIAALLIGAALLLAACAGSPSAARSVADPGASSTPSFQSDDPPDIEIDPRTQEVADETPVPKPEPTPKGGVPDDDSAAKNAQGASSESRQTRAQPSQSTPQVATEYTWQDGDRAMKVTFQPDLVLQDASSPIDTEAAKVETGKGVIVQKDDATNDTGQPVFRAPSGALMTLPGGVLLVLEDGWTEAEVNAFFAKNGIKLDRVSELSYATNGFFIETEPGFPSLDLANKLAGEKGVIISSPNWWTQVATR